MKRSKKRSMCDYSRKNKKQIKIKPFKRSSVDKEYEDPNYVDRISKLLEDAFLQILSLNRNVISSLQFDQLYRIAYKMVLYRHGEKLYSGLVTTITAHLKETTKSIEATAQGVSLLEELNRKWTDHSEALEMIRDILMYMDKTFVVSTDKTPVYELGMNLWRDIVIHSSIIQTRLRNTLFELIQREKIGEDIDRELLRNITKMLKDLGFSVSKDNFEKMFLETSGDSTG